VISLLSGVCSYYYSTTRPLSDELRRYAQSDTHYLLYIYDRLRSEAVAKGNANNNLMQAILNRSRDICLTVHDKVERLLFLFLLFFLVLFHLLFLN
jgi:hypothetical protein